MTDTMRELEREIEVSRARLDMTVQQLQSRANASGVVEDTLGAVQRSPYAPLYRSALQTIRRNPIPVLLIVAGFSMFVKEMAKPVLTRRRRLDIRPVVDNPFPTAPVATDAQGNVVLQDAGVVLQDAGKEYAALGRS
jgi:hypothetical protein